MAGGASPAVREAYAAYGLALGIGFQEQDDLLGVWGRSAETGKPDAADIVERKRGLPAAIALSEPDVPAWLSAAYAPGDGAVADGEMVERIVRHFDQLGVRGAIEQRVEASVRRGAGLPGGGRRAEPARGYLSAICDALVSRRT